MSIASDAFRMRISSLVPSIDEIPHEHRVRAIIDSIPSLVNAKSKKPHNSAKRKDRDFYPTPSWCAKGMINLIKFNADDVLLEPCIGSRRIANHFPKGHESKWAELEKGVDYLKQTQPMSADVIITNPPFSAFMDFITASLARDLNEGGTVCYLLRLSVLGSKERSDFWRLFPPTHIITMSPRPSFTEEDESKAGKSDNSEYAWFCWDFGNRLNVPFLWNIKKEEVNG